jgi:uncharacterized protein
MIHTYKMNGYNIVLDVNSGSIHVTDDITYEILNAFDTMPTKEQVLSLFKGRNTEDRLTDVWQEIKELYDEGVLYSEDPQIALDPELSLYKGLKAICLHVAHDCNLRCEYCFASKGDYKTGRSLMSKEIALKALDYLVEHSGRRKNIEVDFFGGEPLMNFDVVKAAVEYGKSLEEKFGKKFFFTMTTNAVHVTEEQAEFLNEHMGNIVISLDGRKSVNDRMRKNAAGKGTYEQIVKNAKKITDNRKGKPYFIRGTFTSLNKDFSEDVRHIRSLGFREISIEPVTGKGESFHIKEEDLDDILREYEKFAIEYAKDDTDYRFYHFNIDIYDGPCLSKRITACGSGTEYVAVAPDGKIYPCHQFVGQEEFAIGDLETGITDRQMQLKFASAHVFGKEDCKGCWAIYFCSGGCHANAYYTNGDIFKPDKIACTLQKKRIECAIMIQVARS